MILKLGWLIGKQNVLRTTWVMLVVGIRDPSMEKAKLRTRRTLELGKSIGSFVKRTHFLARDDFHDNPEGANRKIHFHDFHDNPEGANRKEHKQLRTLLKNPPDEENKNEGK